MSSALKQRLVGESAHHIERQRSTWESTLKGAPQPADDLEYIWEFEREHRLRQVEDQIDAWVKRVPPLYQDASLDALTEDQRPDQIRAYLAGGIRNLILAGPVGTGKSFAAWAIAHQVVALGDRAAVWSAPRLMVDMRPDGDPGAFREACEVPLLVIDDLGAARPTDWATEQMFSIADERTNFDRRTVVTTNATFPQLEAIWGRPTMDRFRDRAAFVEMIGASRRGGAS